MIYTIIQLLFDVGCNKLTGKEHRQQMKGSLPQHSVCNKLICMPMHECAYIHFSLIKALKWWEVSFNDPVLCYPHVYHKSSIN